MVTVAQNLGENLGGAGAAWGSRQTSWLFTLSENATFYLPHSDNPLLSHHWIGREFESSSIGAAKCDTILRHDASR